MPTLSDVILQENVGQVQRFLARGGDVNALDEYGFTPLIESAIVNNSDITKILLEHGAHPNGQDVTGGTPLHWATENNNLMLAKLLLDAKADPNLNNFAGQSPLVMPMLREHTTMRQLLLQYGADTTFAQDYINAKLAGHSFELMGVTHIVNTKNQLIDVDYEGFFLEVTIGLVRHSLSQFQNHFAARKLRRYLGVMDFIQRTLDNALSLVRYQQYLIDVKKHDAKITSLLQHDPLIIPIGYEGHAITFLTTDNIWVKCDRREDSRLYDNVMLYFIGRPENLTQSFLKHLIYEKQTGDYINNEIDQILDLRPFTEIKVEAQISGNCSWANVEATIPALFFLILLKSNFDQSLISKYKSIALDFFHQWRAWNKERILQFCMKRFQESDFLRKAGHAEILAAILFQRYNAESGGNAMYVEPILQLLLNSPYEYILKNYLSIYYYENYTDEGKRFFDLLRSYGLKT